MTNPATGHESWRDAAEERAGHDPEAVNRPDTGAHRAPDTQDPGFDAVNAPSRNRAGSAAAAESDAEAARRARLDAEQSAERARVSTGDARRPYGESGGDEDAGDRVPMRSMPLGMAVTSGPGRFFFALGRILLGWVFLWAFLDKLFGLGFDTGSNGAWINGGSPTTGYLESVDGPLAGFFNSLAGQAWVDWVFMIGLAAIGVALILGIAVWLAAITGAAMLVLMWLAELPIDTNPFLDYHLVYAVVLLGLAFVRAGDTLGLGRLWARSGLVRALPFLR